METNNSYLSFHPVSLFLISLMTTDAMGALLACMCLISIDTLVVGVVMHYFEINIYRFCFESVFFLFDVRILSKMGVIIKDSETAPAIILMGAIMAWDDQWQMVHCWMRLPMGSRTARLVHSISSTGIIFPICLKTNDSFRFSYAQLHIRKCSSWKFQCKACGISADAVLQEPSYTEHVPALCFHHVPFYIPLSPYHASSAFLGWIEKGKD